MSKKSTDTWNRGIFLALIKLFHFIAVVQYVYAIYYDVKYVHFPATVNPEIKRTSFGGKFKYLTFLDAVSLWLSDESLRKIFDGNLKW